VNHLRAITVAGFLAATVLPAAAAEISGAGATFPLSGLCQMGGHLQERDRCRTQLSVNRFRWRY
jgi:hypothetical protein